MRVESVETLQLAEYPNVLWVQVATNEGLVGVGETFFGANAVAAYIHETVAPYLIGKDPLQIDRHSRFLLNPFVGFSGSGVETRGTSAIDVALWDIFGQFVGQPIHQLLGGLSRDRIKIYNTCAGYKYIRGSRISQSSANWGLNNNTADGPYEDLEAFLERADELAESLLEQGITAMKIWPFDIAAEKTGGLSISATDLKKALEPFEKIRRSVGDRIDIMVEFHSLWNTTTAKYLGHALEDYRPFWLEDLIKMNNPAGLAEIRHSVKTPICASETIATRPIYRDFMERRATDIVMLDVSWVGGLSEAKKIATMAEAFDLPVAPHDCVGPITMITSIHLALNAPNALIQETVRAFYTGWYKNVLTDMPVFRDGFAYPMTGAGLGTKLNPERFAAADATRRVTRASDLL
jgi:L-alanine-DL-glutamate epimerase-like enolase superfamily enzyme